MNPDNISTQPTMVPKMQMTIEGVEANGHKDNENLASRTRGGGAASKPKHVSLEHFPAFYVVSVWSAAATAWRVLFVAHAKYVVLVVVKQQMSWTPEC
ncbi:unnamed protein product [Rhizoctonia solani]|uniref:Uncharacterized protein n=1 Tax=Rhizoctonia solani TaxID=456999 RepID=A0A8H3BJ53_9AGAM|nr:unnamed protein product [Rhizoctonia solani]